MALQVLAGTVTRKTPTAILTRRRCLLAAASEAPTVGSALSSPLYATTVGGICVAVGEINQVRYPGRYVVDAVFEQPFLESEVGTL